MRVIPSAAAGPAAMTAILDVEPWTISGVILGGSLLAICVLYIVVRFRQPGDER